MRYVYRRKVLALARITTAALTVLLLSSACYFFRGTPNYGRYGRLESAVQTNIGTFSRGQQVYFLENQTFTASLEALEIGWHLEAEQALNYRYEVTASDESAVIYAIPHNPEYAYRLEGIGFFTRKIKITRPMGAWAGGVFIVRDAAGTQPQIKGIVCRTELSEITQPVTPILQSNEPVCSDGAEKVRDYVDYISTH
ncbi:MAG: type IV pilin-like G/H family protein [Cyanobacteria bacterium J06626_18]